MPAIQWINWGNAGAMASPELSLRVLEMIQPEMQFDPLCEIVNLGKGKGDTHYYSSVTDLGGGTTFAQNIIGELADIPVDTWSQVRNGIQVYELGRATAVSHFTESLAAIDVNKIARGRLGNHMKRVMDSGAATAAVGASVIYTALTAATGSWGTAGVASGTSAHNMTAWHWREVADYMFDTLKIQPYDSRGNYLVITIRKGVRGLYDDPEFREVAKYRDAEGYMRGEVGTYYKCRFIETNNADALTTCGTAGVCAQAVVMGKDSQGTDAVMKVLVEAPIITAEPGRHGRGWELAWHGILGYGVSYDYIHMAQTNLVFVGSL